MRVVEHQSDSTFRGAAKVLLDDMAPTGYACGMIHDRSATARVDTPGAVGRIPRRVVSVQTRVTVRTRDTHPERGRSRYVWARAVVWSPSKVASLWRFAGVGPGRMRAKLRAEGGRWVAEAHRRVEWFADGLAAATTLAVAAVFALAQVAVGASAAPSVGAKVDRPSERCRTPLARMVVSLVIAPGAPGVPVAA